MDTMSELRERSNELRSQGLTALRAFRVLRKEYPIVERDMLLMATKLEGYPKGIMPRWTEWGNSLRPTQMRFQPKERCPMSNYPLMPIKANRLEAGDWIEGYGHAVKVAVYSCSVRVWFPNDEKFFQLIQPLEVRLEDHGQEG